MNTEEIRNHMLNSNRRGNMVWLAAMLIAIVGLVSAGQLAVLGVVSIVSLLFFMYTAIIDGQSLNEIADRLKDANPFNRPEQSDWAKKAVMNASRRPDFDTGDYHIKDIGVVIENNRLDGLRLRQARLVSLDDEALRPFLTVHAPHSNHPRQTLIRFEIRDGQGNVIFTVETDHWMKPGENIVIPNYRLPLKGNENLSHVGAWDVAVWVDHGLVGIHDFGVSPPADERRRQFSADGEAQVPVRLEQKAAPVALDDILSQQRNRSSSGNS